MENYNVMITRHGETGVQAILENWEQFAGVSYTMPTSLETRWANFIRATEATPSKMAA